MEEHGTPENHFIELAGINVNQRVEKKGKPGGKQFSYLSWAWAVDQLMRRDPSANWEYAMFGEPTLPYLQLPDGTGMVFCSVTAFGAKRTAQLPIMDHANNPITNPTSFELNTAMQRCLAKGIALHGLGLYIYAGEDLPLSVGEECEEILELIRKCKTEAELEVVAVTIGKFAEANPELRDTLADSYRLRKNMLAGEKSTRSPQGVKALTEKMRAKEEGRG